jgi:dihydropteroate synthase
MKKLEWGKRTYTMGIINITPDSFSGDGTLVKNNPIAQAIEQALQFIQDGADILDLGAESSRPGSEPIPASTEIDRILPVLQSIKNEGIDVPISIDTYKAETAKICLENGADWINDIWGGKADPKISEIAAARNASIIIMHNRSRSQAVRNLGTLGSTYKTAKYKDVIQDILLDLSGSITAAKKAGVPDKNIIIDPGIGFGKSRENNLAIINRLDEFKALGYPILIGPSRKSFIGQTLDLPIGEREEGTAAAIAIGIARGADIIRVHNVKKMARVAKMCDAILSQKPK